MTRIKICGITSVDDALAAVTAGADALGFVFTDSPRRISPDRARAITDRLPPFVRRVGVFRDARVEEIEAIAEEAGLDTIQLHGDESPLLCSRVRRPVLKRLRVTDDDTPQSLRERFAAFRVAACLLDPGAGEGKTFRWELGRALGPQLIVAGGLTQDNVAEAIRAARPYAVDVSSGVEATPGRKDRARMEAFVRAVRREDASDAA